jgi:hypothetical protein
MSPNTQPAQPTPIAQPPQTNTPPPQPVPSTSPANPQVTQPAPNTPNRQGRGVTVLPGQGVTFEQIDILRPEPPQPNSNHARVSTDAKQLLQSTGISSGYLNIFTDQGWVIRNLVVDMNGPGRISEYFKLGLAQPRDVTSRSAYIVFSPTPQSLFTDGPRSNFPVGSAKWALPVPP